jgi:hypothetical protein
MGGAIPTALNVNHESKCHQTPRRPAWYGAGMRRSHGRCAFALSLAFVFACSADDPLVPRGRGATDTGVGGAGVGGTTDGSGAGRDGGAGGGSSSGGGPVGAGGSTPGSGGAGTGGSGAGTGGTGTGGAGTGGTGTGGSTAPGSGGSVATQDVDTTHLHLAITTSWQKLTIPMQIGDAAAGSSTEVFADFEDGQAKVGSIAGRGGDWFHMGDPDPTLSVEATPQGGAPGSQKALHIVKAAGSWAQLAGIVNNWSAYDMSSYSAVTFWAKGTSAGASLDGYFTSASPSSAFDASKVKWVKLDLGGAALDLWLDDFSLIKK